MPGPVVPWQHRSVGVQQGAIGRVGDCPQDVALPGRRIIEQQQGLIGVHGDDSGIETAGRVATGPYHDPVGRPAQRMHRGAGANLVQTRGDGTHIVDAAAGDSAPRR